MFKSEMNPTEVIKAFDVFLSQKGFRYQAVVIGGSALNILNVTTRETVDFDILSPKLTEEILELAGEFREFSAKNGLHLIEKWLNNGPESLLRDLPENWETNAQVIFQGTAITLKTLGRLDLIKSKLFAYCDREEPDRGDLLKLIPTPAELSESLEWVQQRDGNPGWPNHVSEKFKQLRRALGYGV